MRSGLFVAVALFLPLASQAVWPQEAVDAAVEVAFSKFPALKTNQLAVTAIDLTGTNVASFRGDAPIYPASVVKLFYLAAAHRGLEDGKIQDSEELERALRDMIVDSSNDATHHVLDVVTGTTAGPELSGEARKDWEFKRNAINRYFEGLGYQGVNANQKTWCEGPYGRERTFVGKNFENRNVLTTLATAKLMAEIARRTCVSEARSELMLALLKRDPFKKGDSQATDYVGAALPEGARLWSKAGWTSTARHDVAYVELPGGKKLVLAIFTTGQSREKGIIPAIAKSVFDRFGTPAVD